MNLADVRAGITAALQTIPRFRVYDTFPGQLSPPAAVLALGPGTYEDDFDGAIRVTWTAVVLLSRADDTKAQQQLDKYLSSGYGTIIDAVNEDQTLFGTVDSCRVVGWNEPATFTIAGIDYIGAEVNIEAIG